MSNIGAGIGTWIIGHDAVHFEPRPIESRVEDGRMIITGVWDVRDNPKKIAKVKNLRDDSMEAGE